VTSSRSDSILLSIAPEHAQAIYSGKKRAELRKQFAKDARIVVLYETAPVTAITGAFVVQKVNKLPIRDAVKLAGQRGVSEERARRYFEGREFGSVIEIALPLKFARPITLSALRIIDSRFSVPQSFSFLRDGTALERALSEPVMSELAKRVSLRKIQAAGREDFASLIRSYIAPNYEDIDEDFEKQVLKGGAAPRAFSTDSKYPLEIVAGTRVCGYTVLTDKVHGAWKSGPTILRPDWQRSGLGQAARRAMERFVKAKGGLGIYCTCSEERPEVVSYLLKSGLKLQARLSKHLAKNRDEYVFARRFANSQTKVIKKRVGQRFVAPYKARKVVLGSLLQTQAVRYFISLTREWYFAPPRSMARSLTSSLAIEGASARKRYSEKSRTMYVCSDGRGSMCGAVLLTAKRSGMAKLNVVSGAHNPEPIVAIVKRILREQVRFRRLYLTLPSGEMDVMRGLGNLGFRFEGLLESPFRVGVDHVCLGYVR
jgi:predicted transcriptional regulator